jgi:hypothetical protein
MKETEVMCEVGDTVYVTDPETMSPPRVPSSVPGYVKHVHCNGARFHVLSWVGSGRRCSEPECVENAKVENGVE